MRIHAFARSRPTSPRHCAEKLWLLSLPSAIRLLPRPAGLAKPTTRGPSCCAPGWNSEWIWFASESGRKIDGLTQSLSPGASTLLRDEVSARLGDIKNSLEVTVRVEAHQLQLSQTESISAAIRNLESSVEQRQLRQQSAIDAKLALLGQSVFSTLTEISQLQKAEMQDLKANVNARRSTVEHENEKKLEQMRHTVDEKLQGTLEARLGQSFRQVSERLEQVYSGLGEMKSLANGVGDLKRVLTNVKTRGTWGEVQLGAIIEQILAPTSSPGTWPLRVPASALNMPSSYPAATIAVSRSGFPSTPSSPWRIIRV